LNQSSDQWTKFIKTDLKYHLVSIIIQLRSEVLSTMTITAAAGAKGYILILLPCPATIPQIEASAKSSNIYVISLIKLNLEQLRGQGNKTKGMTRCPNQIFVYCKIQISFA